MSEIITVKPEFSSEDCFRIVERHKRRFTYPMHRHKAVELNFIQTEKGYGGLSGTVVRKSATTRSPSSGRTSSTPGNRENVHRRMSAK